MLNIPALKFEKSIKYLENELSVQNSNRELLLDVIANINLISKNSTKEEKDHLDAVLFEANDLLSQSSNMISDLEHLKLEIETITKELNSVLGDKNLRTKTKEYFIATFSDIKKKITIYTVKFKDVETNVKVQNERVNNFIKANNLQYNFDSTDDGSKEIQFADFSMDSGKDTVSNVTATEEVQEEVTEEVENVQENVEEAAQEEAVVNDEEKVEEQDVNDTTLSDEQSDAINNLTSEFRTLITEVAKGNITEDVTPIIMSYFKQFDGENVEEDTSRNEEVVEENVSDQEVIDENYFNTNIIDELRSMITTGITNIERDIEKRTTTNTNSIENISEDFVDASTNIDDTIQQEEFINNIISENESVENEIYNDVNEVPQEEETTSVEEDNQEDNIEDITDDVVVQDNDFVIEKESEETVEPVISFADDDNIEDVEDVDDSEEIEEIEDAEDVDDSEEVEEIEDAEDVDNGSTTIDLSSYDDNYMIQIDKDSNYSNIFTFDAINLNKSSKDVVEYSDIVDTPIEVTNVESESIVDNVTEEDTNEEFISDDTVDDESLLEALVETEEAESLLNETSIQEETTETVDNSDIIPFEEEDNNAEIKIDFYQRSEIDDLYEKIAKIKLAQADNETLIISKEHGIILPYKLTELKEYMDSYPGLYKSFTDVVEQEFILPYNYFSANEKKCRFDEAYNLMKNKEGASAISAYKYAKAISKENELHPAIVAACRNQRELDAYLYYMQEGELDRFKYFNIYYEE